MYYTKESECPDIYLHWAALTTLSGAVQRGVFTRWVYKKFYPNMYTILVGPPGITHKGSAIGFGYDFLRDIKVPVASQSITKEGLIVQMQKRGDGTHNSLVVMSDEFGSFFDKSAHLMIGFLTDIYDCKDNWEDTTKHGGTINIEKPYLTMLAGTTPSWIADNFDHNFTDKGFAARTIFVSATRPRFLRARVTITDEMMQMRKDLLHDLLIIKTVKGEFIWTRHAEEWFDDWYENNWQESILDYRLASYLGRKPTHIIRLSMLLALNESNRLLLAENHLERAKDHLEKLEPSMVKTFSAVGKNPYASDLERMANDIRNAGRICRSDMLARNVHAMDKKTMDESIETLIAMGKIEKELSGGEVWYYTLED